MPKRLAVLGQPILPFAVSAMQTAALAELGLADEWSYEAIEVAPRTPRRAGRAMPGEGFVGANVTVPHKLAALAIANAASEAARAIGAANMLTFGDARIAAENTDATGLLDALPESRPAPARSCSARGLGSGRRLGARGRGADVSIWNRTPRRRMDWRASSVQRPKPSTRPISTCS
jgi:shikimate dehydrogenase